ncbi:MAG: hypothetical protein B7X04_00665 [Parcubacteria group bacterium 21-54-25]|nr:MAG: hypothetical protein B7X04_00665 [Parcubacteria group bacterium 21-54-25]
MDEGTEVAGAEVGVVSRVHEELVPTSIDGSRGREAFASRHDETEISFHIAKQLFSIGLREAQLALVAFQQFQMLVVENISQEIIRACLGIR